MLLSESGSKVLLINGFVAPIVEPSLINVDSLTPPIMNSDRQKAVRFHVDAKDYFSSLATTLGLIQEMSGLEAGKAEAALREIRHITSALKRLSDDLVYLQENYEIVKKERE